MQREEEEEKKSKPSPPPKKLSFLAKSGIVLSVNLFFFALFAAGLMFFSGKSIFDLMGVTYWAAKSKDDGSL
jgi:hypothetical protein